MAQIAPHVGIDCSDAQLDVHIHPCELVFSVGNDPEGWRELDRRLAEAQAEIVAIESTGGPERDVSLRQPKGSATAREIDAEMKSRFAEIWLAQEMVDFALDDASATVTRLFVNALGMDQDVKPPKRS